MKTQKSENDMAKTNKLELLYQLFSAAEQLGKPFPEEYLTEITELEEQLIKDEVLPLIHDNIEPILQQVKRPLVLVVEYDPSGSLRVNLSRKVNIAATISDAKEIVLDPEANHKTYGQNSDTKIVRSPASDMSVSFPDGSIIAEKTAAETFVAVIKKIGVMKARRVVEEHNLKFCKVPVISNRRDAKYGRSQRDLGDGWLLITHSNNRMKKAFIEKVSDILGLGIKVMLKN